MDSKFSTRALIDRMGMITQPRINGMPMGNNKCPAGDSCPNLGADPYSDFTVYPVQNEARPSGSYQVLVKGCTDANGAPADTRWMRVEWESDVPPNTSLIARAMSGNSSNLAEVLWSTRPWTADTIDTPLDLEQALTPNWTPGGPNDVQDGWLRLEFYMKTSAFNASPKLKNFDVVWRCPRP